MGDYCNVCGIFVPLGESCCGADEGLFRRLFSATTPEITKTLGGDS